jgi:hypothetical protein
MTPTSIRTRITISIVPKDISFLLIQEGLLQLIDGVVEPTSRSFQTSLVADE